MAQRKRTPDILGDLLGSKPALAESVVETPKPQSVLPAKRQGGETAKQQGSQPASQQSGKELRQQEDLPVEQQDAETLNHQEVLPAKRQSGITVRRQNGLPLSQQSSIPARHQSGLTAKRQTAKLAEEAESEAGEVEAKTKMTFYLSEDSVELLEDAQRALRRMAKKAGKVQPKGITSKSALLEAALKLACEDLEVNGEQSRFASLIA